MPTGESETLDNMNKKQRLGWSNEQLQRDFGLSDEHIKKMTEENQRRAVAESEAKAKMFDSGMSLMS